MTFFSTKDGRAILPLGLQTHNSSTGVPEMLEREIKAAAICWKRRSIGSALKQKKASTILTMWTISSFAAAPTACIWFCSGLA